ncbi:MAG: hypothetical protein AAFY60_10795, partial [Myxococcota bacterium]
MVSAYHRALSGDFSDSAGEPEAQLLWRSMAFAAGMDVKPLTPEALPDTPHLLSSLTCLQEIRAASISLGARNTQPWLDKHRRCHEPSIPRSTCALALSEAWHALGSMPDETLLLRLTDVERSARAEGFAELVVEAAALRALTCARMDLTEAMLILAASGIEDVHVFDA